MGLKRLYVPERLALQIEEALAEVAAPPVALVRDATEDMALVAEEQFGPVRPSSPTGTSTRALTRVNAGDLGPARRGRRASGGRHVLGRPAPDAPTDVPFSDLKQSGLGVESALHGLLAYTDISVLRV